MLRAIKSKNTGFASITEVIVTSIIFLVAVGGILASVTMVRPQGIQSFERLEATYAGKAVLDDLYSGVSASTWMDNSSVYAVNRIHTVTVNGLTINYLLEDMTGFPAGTLPPRKLTMNITLPDVN